MTRTRTYFRRARRFFVGESNELLRLWFTGEQEVERALIDVFVFRIYIGVSTRRQECVRIIGMKLRIFRIMPVWLRPTTSGKSQRTCV